MPSPQILVGSSACLLGEKVRYNGADKRNTFIVDKVGKYFHWLPLCPEVEIGLGIPREPLRLEARGKTVRLVTVSTSQDLTTKMTDYATRKVAALTKLRLCGFLLKKNSPSCGMEKVKVYDANGSPFPSGQGLFAKELRRQLPNLPVEEEGRLENPKFRENWIARVFAYDRLQKLWESPWRLGDLVEFHTRHKLTLMAHSPQAYRDLGQMVAKAKPVKRSTLREEYEAGFMAALTHIATPGRNANVLSHMMGWFRGAIDTEIRAEMRDLIDEYQRGEVPLVVPLTLIAHYIRKQKIEYLAKQFYLAPHPKELALRNYA